MRWKIVLLVAACTVVVSGCSSSESSEFEVLARVKESAPGREPAVDPGASTSIVLVGDPDLSSGQAVEEFRRAESADGWDFNDDLDPRLELGRPDWVLLEGVKGRDEPEQKVMWVGAAADYFNEGFGDSSVLLADDDVQEALGRTDLLVVAEASRAFEGGLPE